MSPLLATYRVASPAVSSKTVVISNSNKAFISEFEPDPRNKNVVYPQLFSVFKFGDSAGMTNENHAERNIPKLALTRTEAALSLGVRPVTIDRLTKRGLLHPSRATRRPLYSVKEIERFLKETTDCS